MNENSPRSPQAGPGAQNRTQGNAASFVPPSIDMVTGKSVMPENGAGIPPLAPSPARTPDAVSSPYYVAGFLKNYIGRDVTVQFMIGEGALVDRTGRLMEVGASFIVLQPAGTDDLLMCDMYSIKFVTIYR
jgi:hypothetical protein